MLVGDGGCQSALCCCCWCVAVSDWHVCHVIARCTPSSISRQAYAYAGASQLPAKMSSGPHVVVNCRQSVTARRRSKVSQSSSKDGKLVRKKLEVLKNYKLFSDQFFIFANFRGFVLNKKTREVQILVFLLCNLLCNLSYRSNFIFYFNRDFWLLASCYIRQKRCDRKNFVWIGLRTCSFWVLKFVFRLVCTTKIQKKSMN